MFSENTIAALKTSSFKEQSAGTVSFLELIVKFWKIVNVKGVNADSRFNDTDRAPIRYIDDPRLTFLLNLADVADSMKGTAKSRVKCYHQRSCYRQHTSGENQRQRTQETVDL